MICKHCNSTIADDSIFCPSCGQKAEPAPAPAQGKFCTACGAPLEDGVKFCISCGTPVAAADPATPTYAAPTYAYAPAPEAAPAAPAEDKPLKVNLSKKTLMGIILGGAGALLIGLIVLLIVLLTGGRSVEETVEQFVSATATGDVEALLELYPEEMIDMQLEDGDYTRRELINELKDEFEENRDDMEDEYGKYRGYEYEIRETEPVTGLELRTLQMTYKMYLDLEVEEAVEVEVKMVMEFDDEDIKQTETFTLVKIGSTWYFAELDF